MIEKRFELTTNIGRLDDLGGEWLQYYDSVYLGDPFCDLLTRNLTEHTRDLEEAVQRLHELDKRAYLSTHVEPWTDDLARISDAVAAAVELGVDGIEVLNLGVLHLVAKKFANIKIHLNGFIQAFNPVAASVLGQYQVRRLMPYHELGLDEVELLRHGTELELELPIHGHIPLGYAEFCMIHPTRVAEGKPCRGDCYRDFLLRHRDYSLRCAGRMTASGKDLCMIDHLDLLLARGYSVFRIESRLRDEAYRVTVGSIYRRCLEQAASGRAIEALEVDREALNECSPEGLCNGYYFGQSGIQQL
jgi:putative protease